MKLLYRQHMKTATYPKEIRRRRKSIWKNNREQLLWSPTDGAKKLHLAVTIQLAF